MHVYTSDHFVLPLPPEHRFPMAKYRLLREAVTAHASAWGIQLLQAPAAAEVDLLRVHCPAYVARVRDGTLSEREQTRLGFPWSEAMAIRTRHVSGATCAALVAALEQGVAVNLAGGTHHAGYDHGAGYCVFNDSVIAARHVQTRGLARRVLVVDLDVHHGNGTAALTRRDASIYAFSMHAERNYPAVKPAGDLDIGLPDGTGDAAYLEALRGGLAQALEESRPDCAIYLAGADPYVGDRLGLLSLSMDGLRARDAHVFDTLRAAGVPVAVTMAGGYAEDVGDIVAIHLGTLRLAAAAARSWTVGS